MTICEPLAGLRAGRPEPRGSCLHPDRTKLSCRTGLGCVYVESRDDHGWTSTQKGLHGPVAS